MKPPKYMVGDRLILTGNLQPSMLRDKLRRRHLPVTVTAIPKFGQRWFYRLTDDEGHEYNCCDQSEPWILSPMDPLLRLAGEA